MHSYFDLVLVLLSSVATSLSSCHAFVVPSHSSRSCKSTLVLPNIWDNLLLPKRPKVVVRNVASHTMISAQDQPADIDILIKVHQSHPWTDQEKKRIPNLLRNHAFFQGKSISVLFEDGHKENNSKTTLDTNWIGSNCTTFCYSYSKSTGMLKRLNSSSSLSSVPISTISPTQDLLSPSLQAPRWIPLFQGEEEVLIMNGWSFLDSDEAEPISAFDVDIANKESQYQPKWGLASNENLESSTVRTNKYTLSRLGYDVKPMSTQEIIMSSTSSYLSTRVNSKEVLLKGSTDPPGHKITNNGYDFSGSVVAPVDTTVHDYDDDDDNTKIPLGIFFCAIGSLPLFSSADLTPCTASSGWLNFVEPISTDHVLLLDPSAQGNEEKKEKNTLSQDNYSSTNDMRIEVICARSRCHLGHYFGKRQGYCINASALNFVPLAQLASPFNTNIMKRRKQFLEPNIDSNFWSSSYGPVSWRKYRDFILLSRTTNCDFFPTIQSAMLTCLAPSERILLNLLQEKTSFNFVVLGAGCFWHVEYALSRLPGVVSTRTGYAGGFENSVQKHVSYEDVTGGDTGFAEVVLVVFDPLVLPPSTLFDCFFAMHDPTRVRAHGKRAPKSGQYRSCMFVGSEEMRRIAYTTLNECQQQIRKMLSTEITLVSHEFNGEGKNWFWQAEDRHQRQYERVRGLSGPNLTETMTITDWLMEFGRRSSSIWGSSNTINPSIDEYDSNDDGTARLMI